MNPRDSGLNLDAEIENHPGSQQSTALKGSLESESYIQATEEGNHSENSTINNLARSSETLLLSGLAIGVGLFILSGPFTPFWGFAAFMSLSSGFAGGVLGLVELGSSFILDEEKHKQQHVGISAGLTLTGSPGGFWGGTGGVLTGGDLESLQDGAF